MSTVWKMIQEKNEIAKHMPKSTSIFWFPVKGTKIPDTFYKIQQFITMSWASVNVHKDLLDLVIWM